MKLAAVAKNDESPGQEHELNCFTSIKFATSTIYK
jgi:hypothetical protein